MNENGCETHRPEGPTEVEKLQELILKMEHGITEEKNVEIYEISDNLQSGFLGLALVDELPFVTTPLASKKKKATAPSVLKGYSADSNRKISAYFEPKILVEKVAGVRTQVGIVIKFLDPVIKTRPDSAGDH